jgi:hypothetical protein
LERPARNGWPFSFDPKVLIAGIDQVLQRQAVSEVCFAG